MNRDPVATPSTLAHPVEHARWRDDVPVDGHLRDWLTSDRLLTPDLERSLGGPVVIEVLAEADGPLPPWVCATLECDTASGWTREVRLSVSGQAVVHALCFLPARTLQVHPWLRALENRPLGSALRARGTAVRDGLQFAPGDDRLGAGGWLRRSRFVLDDVPLLLVEQLSPELAHYPRRME